MNKRFRELAEQAGWMMGDDEDGFTFRLNKFAQLLVLECCQLVEDNGTYITKSGAIKPTAPWETTKMLKAQFDIEE